MTAVVRILVVIAVAASFAPSCKQPEETGGPSRTDVSREPTVPWAHVDEKPAKPAEPAEVAQERGGEAPTFSMIRAKLGIAKQEKVRVLGKPLPLGDGRFVCTICRQPGEGLGEHARLIVLVVSRVADGARIESRVELQAGRSHFAGDEDDDADFGFLAGEDEPAVLARDVGDLDGDGEVEAWLVVKYSEIERAVGEVQRKHTFVIDVDPAASVAFSRITSLWGLESECDIDQTLRLRYRDVDGDGHPDIVLKGKLEKECGEVVEIEETHLWDEASDTWRVSG